MHDAAPGRHDQEEDRSEDRRTCRCTSEGRRKDSVVSDGLLLAFGLHARSSAPAGKTPRRPLVFVAIPEDVSADVKFAARGVEYWGRAPVMVRINGAEFQTALFPKDGIYLRPLKNRVRDSAGIEVDQNLTVALTVGRQ